jgi:hypothetical protein
MVFEQEKKQPDLVDHFWSVCGGDNSDPHKVNQSVHLSQKLSDYSIPHITATPRTEIKSHSLYAQDSRSSYKRMFTEYFCKDRQTF